MDWHGKPYYSLDAFFKNTYGMKCYKIAVDAGCTCPNRDGQLDTRGCIFCSAGGSGDFSVDIRTAGMKDNDTDASKDSVYYKMYNRVGLSSIEASIERGIAMFNKRPGERFVIYFQAFTNTYGDIERLSKMWMLALEHEKTVGISVATRPDCLGEDVMKVLYEVSKTALNMGKFVWIELGLQTIHDKTAEYIRRHFSLAEFDSACEKLDKVRIPFIVHVILGLPNESQRDILETISYVNNKHPFGIKLQLLHVLKGTDLAKDYEAGKFDTLSMEEYIDIVIDCINHLDENIVIHRVTGDGPKDILIDPKWSANKRKVLNMLHKTMKLKCTRQGKEFSP